MGIGFIHVSDAIGAFFSTGSVWVALLVLAIAAVIGVARYTLRRKIAQPREDSVQGFLRLRFKDVPVFVEKDVPSTLLESAIASRNAFREYQCVVIDKEGRRATANVVEHKETGQINVEEPDFNYCPKCQVIFDEVETRNCPDCGSRYLPPLSQIG